MDKTSYLIKQVRQGDEVAFGELYRDYSGAIYGVLLKMTRDEELSNDLLQDVFVKAWRKMDTYDEAKGRFYTWLYRIAKNTALNELRKNKKENYTGEIGVYDTERGFEHLNVDVLDLKGKVRDLDEKYQQVIDLVYFQGFTHQQVCEKFDIPLGTIKTRLRRAIQALADIYKTDGLTILFILLMASNG